VYGPIEHQRLGIPKFVHESGIARIERFLKYSHIDDDITRQLIRASMKQFSDHILAATYMAVYGRISDAD
jgi:hypothetical protein